MDKKIRVIKVDGASIEVVEIENTLGSLQKEIGGYIEAVTIPEGSWYDASYKANPELAMTIICHEEGKLLGLDPTLILGEWEMGIRGACGQRAHDMVCGTVLITYAVDGEFVSLTDDQIQDGLDWCIRWHIAQWREA